MDTQLNQTSPIFRQQHGVIGTFFAQVYGWMLAGLVITFGFAFAIMFLVERSPELYSILLIATPFVLIGQLVLVLVLSFLINRMNAIISIILFLIYSATMGIFFSVVFLEYTITSILVASVASALTFGVMAVYGFVTKQDLTGWGRLAMFGLIGIIIGSLVNLFVYLISPGFGETMGWIITYLGIGIFIILIAYDTQRLKHLAAEAEKSGMIGSYAIQGALVLYLDFINLFIRLLAIFGKRR